MIVLQWIETSPRYVRWEYGDTVWLGALEDYEEKVLRWKKVRIFLENDADPDDWVIVKGYGS